MKILDIHSHFHTDRNEGTVAYLKETGHILAGPDGSVRGHINYMRKHGISFSVNMPVAWKPESVRVTNALMEKHNAANTNIISFASIHPALGREEMMDELLRIKRGGFKGIKIHPQEQFFWPDSDEMRPVYEFCDKEDLVILTHAGAGSNTSFNKDEIRARPERIGAVLSEYPGLKIIAAHMGGLNMWDEAERYLLGKKIYFDTAYTAIMPPVLLKDFILRHGVGRVLYGTDYPWQDAGIIGAAVLNAVPELENAEKIMFKNAEEMLGISL